MTQADKAHAFEMLHVKGDPLVLFNIWDAGSAKAGEEAGARALATGSWSVAAAHGVDDAEAVPLDDVIANLQRITSVTDLPVSLDFEGGYALEPAGLTANFARVIETGAIGCNFEDQIVGGEGLHATDVQAKRIAALRAASDAAGIPAFVNARTDLFLKSKPDAHAAHLDEAIERATAYADAGASGFFAPGLMDEALIRRLCEAVALPVNVMWFPGVPERARLAELGVARISHGPGPYRLAMKAFSEAAKAVLAG